DAAKVDGANKFKLIRHVDIPVLVPIIVIQLIMSFGNLMNVGFEKAFLLQTDLNSPTSDIIATYVYRQGILKAQYSFSTAVGLFNTAVNLVLLFVVNKICKKMSDISFL
ncbi:MAG TPA: ABC transporter permease subunit, partial [Mobilitalea sp.]|nr:ABC transporter permease subunit [Mobilitalea sp.]